MDRNGVVDGGGIGGGEMHAGGEIGEAGGGGGGGLFSGVAGGVVCDWAGVGGGWREYSAGDEEGVRTKRKDLPQSAERSERRGHRGAPGNCLEFCCELIPAKN